jgi:hypothetical protein
MPRYTIGLTERVEYTLEVDAENPTQALQKVQAYGRDADGVCSAEEEGEGRDRRIYEIDGHEVRAGLIVPAAPTDALGMHGDGCNPWCWCYA